MRFYGWMHKNLNAEERHFVLPLVIWTFIMQSVAFMSSISHDRIKFIFSHTNKSYIFREQFLLLCTDDNLLGGSYSIHR